MKHKAVAHKVVHRAASTCGKCGKKFYGERQAQKLGSHNFAVHVRPNRPAVPVPSLRNPNLIDIMELRAQRDKLSSLISQLETLTA